MSSIKYIDIKKSYIKPEIILIMLDNDISLQLQSPPEGPGETYNFQQQQKNDDPYKEISI